MKNRQYLQIILVVGFILSVVGCLGKINAIHSATPMLFFGGILYIVGWFWVMLVMLKRQKQNRFFWLFSMFLFYWITPLVYAFKFKFKF
ncbi:hypothetical protein EDM00_07700 [Ornithobacterium rhinotracheale]|nr:hypothetical protein [Ornithobacterium rhinotracheale]MRI63871.1 hypothetical protein [Ornithobacterium rhinotracheale]MRJ09381.1 hypothetical protein [Ornithobacterium rhinotracheale]UOH77016.1 hypothetical protein MT996_07240 [Ornithobacterium rhinotracheale]